MDQPMDHETTRRTFVRGVLVGGASLLVPLFVTACARDRGAPGSRAVEYTITDWIAILPSGEVVLGVSQPEVPVLHQPESRQGTDRGRHRLRVDHHAEKPDHIHERGD
jgi:hypothetical protein